MLKLSLVELLVVRFHDLDDLELVDHGTHILVSVSVSLGLALKPCLLELALDLVTELVLDGLACAFVECYIIIHGFSTSF